MGIDLDHETDVCEGAADVRFAMFVIVFTHTLPVFTQDEVVKLQERIAAIMAAGGKDIGGKDVDGADQDSLRALKGRQTH